MNSDISDPARFATGLNSVLKQTGLLCPDERCAADNNLGLLGDVEVSSPAHDPHWLQITTSVGIMCECDQSIYLYERRDGLWNRRLESEQNGYGKQHYRPQWVSGELSPPNSTGDRLFLTVGFNPACWSVWQEGYFRLFRVGARTTTLLDWDQTMFNIGEDVNRKVEAGEALVEFGSSGVVPGFVRRHVLHFKVDGDRVKRVEPLALQPQDFVDEWLSQRWAIYSRMDRTQTESGSLDVASRRRRGIRIRPIVRQPLRRVAGRRQLRETG